MSDTAEMPCNAPSAAAPTEPPEVCSPAALVAGAHTPERINHLFRRSLAANRVHPLHAALLQHRGLAQ